MYLKKQYELPRDWRARVFDWLWARGIELLDGDDRGGWPTEAQLTAAFTGLGFKKLETT